ncbi:hypothetical protein, partial [Bacillus badius]|uniref:hypothetical protein n=1 Tax=Bacillus badius TaxID=1455 RepID=UPI002E23883C|nr:hypothetical protein [Bacillus badius]
MEKQQHESNKNFVLGMKTILIMVFLPAFVLSLIMKKIGDLFMVSKWLRTVVLLAGIVLTAYFFLNHGKEVLNGNIAPIVWFFAWIFEAGGMSGGIVNWFGSIVEGITIGDVIFCAFVAAGGVNLVNKILVWVVKGNDKPRNEKAEQARKESSFMNQFLIKHKEKQVQEERGQKFNQATVTSKKKEQGVLLGIETASRNSMILPKDELNKHVALIGTT